MSVHRKRIPDRDCFTGILVRLVTGCSWDVAARLTPAGETTVRERRTEWLKAGVFDMLVEEALAGYDRIIAPGPVRGRRRRQPAQSPVWRRRDRAQPHRLGQDRLEVVGRD